MQQFTDLSTDGGQTEGHKKRHCRDLFCRKKSVGNTRVR